MNKPLSSVCFPEEDPSVSFIESGVGRIFLNRPTVLNSLNEAMVREIHADLERWRTADLKAIIIASSRPKTFCAGGDVKEIRRLSLSGETEKIDAFFRQEYRLNAAIANHPTPIISLIDGVCMGGGMGISMHGRFRVVTDAVKMAMPETAIGFFPDVGASFFLPRLPGAIGHYLGLTGSTIDHRDALYCGLATHRLPSAEFAELPALIAQNSDIPLASILSRFDVSGNDHDSAAVNIGELESHRHEIDRCFGAPSFDEITSRLRSEGSAWAERVLSVLASRSPQSLRVTDALLRWGTEHTLEDCLAIELRLARAIASTRDFTEGVRTVLVDKDSTAAWQEATEDVDRLVGLITDASHAHRWADEGALAAP